MPWGCKGPESAGGVGGLSEPLLGLETNTEMKSYFPERKWSGAQLPSKVLLQMQSQPPSPEPTGVTVWTGSFLLEGGPGQVQTLTIHTRACCLQGPGVTRALRQGAAAGEPTLPGPGEALLSLAGTCSISCGQTRENPNLPFSLPVLWSWKETPVYVPCFPLRS